MCWERLHSSQRLTVLMLIGLGGVASASIWEFPLRLAWYLLIIGILIFYLFDWKQFYLILGGIILLSGNFYYQFRINQDLLSYYDKNIIATGLIIKDVENNGLEQKITLRLDEVCGTAGRCRSVKSRILISVPLYPQYFYGQVLKFEGKLNLPKDSYAKYLRSQNIWAAVYQPKNIKILEDFSGNIFWNNLYAVKYFILRRLNLILPAPHSSFMAALLLGVRQGLPSTLSDDFRRAGLSHVVAVSGYNISLLANFVLVLSPYFYVKRRTALLSALLLVAVFVALTGASASVLRAGIMGSLALLAKLWSRPGQILNILLLTACLMVVANPFVLLGDLGFQLSFLATVALIYFVPILTKYFPFYKENSLWQENFITTLAATIFTLPLILYNFGIFSVLAIPVNLLILPLIPYLMLFGFLAFLLSLGYLPVARLAGVLLYGLLQAIMTISHYVSHLSWSVWETESFPLFFVFLFYLIFLIMLIRFHSAKNKYESVS